MNNNITELLLNEEKRLQYLKSTASASYKEFVFPFLKARTIKDSDGNDRTVYYIYCDNLNPDQSIKLAELNKRARETSARLCIFDNFIKSQVPEDTLRDYDEYVEPISLYRDTVVRCSNIGMDDTGNFTMYSIKVGPVNIPSPKIMSAVEYARLYTSSLSRILQHALGEEMSRDEVDKEISEACKEVYLNKRNVQQVMKGTNKSI